MASSSGASQPNFLSKLFGEDEKLHIYVVVAVVFVIIAISVLLMEDVPPGSSLSRCTGIALSYYKNACLNELAYSSSNVSVCEYMVGSDAVNLCVYNVSIETKDSGACSAISNSSDKEACIYNIANMTNSSELCASLGPVVGDRCLTQLAAKLKSPAVCSYSSNAYYKSICTSSAALSSAYATANASECSLVNGSTYTNTVSNITVYPAAYATGYDVSANGTITSSYGSPLNYVQYLTNITYSARDLCYMYVAYKRGNSSYCNSVLNTTLSNICVEETQTHPNITNSSIVANTIANYSLNYTKISNALCSNSSLTKQNCTDIVLMYEAMQTKNVSICGTMPLLNSYNCYAYLARTYTNTSYCSYITNASINSACVQNVYYNAS